MLAFLAGVILTALVFIGGGVLFLRALFKGFRLPLW